MPRVTVNGAELYYEVRGTGPPVLLIMGATGDGGHFDALADLLADEFTVISYDRRGNGRSPVPAGWQTTSPEEQADDAAALLDALGTGPAAVFGTSSGGIFALCLLVRHPENVRGAILHEPGLYALVDDFDAVRAPIRALVEEAKEAGGPSAAVERFWCYIVENDDGWNRLAPALRERLRATASTLFEVELGTYELYLPDEETLASLSAPVRLLVSAGRPSLLRRDSRPPRRTLRRRRRHDAGSTRRVSRPPLRVRGGHAAVPPRGQPSKTLKGGRNTARESPCGRRRLDRRHRRHRGGRHRRLSCLVRLVPGRSARSTSRLRSNSLGSAPFSVKALDATSNAFTSSTPRRAERTRSP